MTLLRLCGVKTLGLGTISLSSTAPHRHRVGAGQARNYEQLVLRRDIKRARIHPRLKFLSATEYHSDADYNSRRVGVVVVVVVVTDFKKRITFLCFDRFGSYLVGSCTRVRRFTSYPIFVIRPTQPAQPAYRPKSEKRA